MHIRRLFCAPPTLGLGRWNKNRMNRNHMNQNMGVSQVIGGPLNHPMESIYRNKPTIFGGFTILRNAQKWLQQTLRHIRLQIKMFPSTAGVAAVVRCWWLLSWWFSGLILMVDTLVMMLSAGFGIAEWVRNHSARNQAVCFAKQTEQRITELSWKIQRTLAWHLVPVHRCIHAWSLCVDGFSLEVCALDQRSLNGIAAFWSDTSVAGYARIVHLYSHSSNHG